MTHHPRRRSSGPEWPFTDNAQMSAASAAGTVLFGSVILFLIAALVYMVAV